MQNWSDLERVPFVWSFLYVVRGCRRVTHPKTNHDEPPYPQPPHIVREDTSPTYVQSLSPAPLPFALESKALIKRDSALDHSGLEFQILTQMHSAHKPQKPSRFGVFRGRSIP